MRFLPRVRTTTSWFVTASIASALVACGSSPQKQSSEKHLRDVLPPVSAVIRPDECAELRPNADPDNMGSAQQPYLRLGDDEAPIEGLVDTASTDCNDGDLPFEGVDEYTVAEFKTHANALKALIAQKEYFSPVAVDEEPAGLPTDSECYSDVDDSQTSCAVVVGRFALVVQGDDSSAPPEMRTAAVVRDATAGILAKLSLG